MKKEFWGKLFYKKSYLSSSSTSSSKDDCLNRPAWQFFRISCRLRAETLQLSNLSSNMGHFQGSKEKTELVPKLSVLTTVSRTIISKWTRKGRPGLSWLLTTSRLCLSTNTGFQRHPDISVPPPHAPPAMPLSYHLTTISSCDVPPQPVLGLLPALLCSSSCSRTPVAQKSWGGLVLATREVLPEANSKSSKC